MIRKILLVAVLAGFSPALVQAQADDSILVDAHIVAQDYVEAEVLRVNTTNRTITVRGATRGQTRTFNVAENARVTVNGRQARLRDVRRGDDVRLVMRQRASEVVVADVAIPDTSISLATRQAEPAPVVAQVSNQPTPTPEVRPAVLPSTASSLPLLLLAGLLSLGGAVLLNIRRRIKR